jgi:hypothetical protein
MVLRSCAIHGWKEADLNLVLAPNRRRKQRTRAGQAFAGEAVTHMRAKRYSVYEFATRFRQT